MFRRVPALFLALIFAVFPIFTVSAQDESDPRALEVFDAALAKLETKSIALRKWQYYQTLTTHQLDSNDKVVGKGVWRSIFRPGSKDPIQYLSETKEGKLSFFQDEPEKTDKADPKKDAAPQPSPANEEDPDSANRIESLADAIRKYGLRDRYVWTRLPDGKAAGESASVISFAPKPGQPTKTKMQRFLGLLTGTIWISKEDDTVLKSEGSLTAPYRLFWIIAQVTKVDFTYEVEPAPANRLLRTSKSEAETIVALPFSTVRQKHWLEVEKYEPRTSKK